MDAWPCSRSRGCAACSTSGRSSWRVAAGIVLVALADGAMSRFAAWIYVMALAAMFGASALYHRYPFKTAARRVWARRLDHSTIFLFIAGTYTPFALARVRRHDHLGRPRDRLVRRCARARAQLLLAPRAEVGQRARLCRGRLGRRGHDPADVLGRGRARLRARDGRAVRCTPSARSSTPSTGRTRSRRPSASTRSSTCSSWRRPRCSSSR